MSAEMVALLRAAREFVAMAQVSSLQARERRANVLTRIDALLAAAK